MALYCTPAVAQVRLERWAGVSVPSAAGTYSHLGDLISEASALIEEFIGYAWEVKPFTERVPIGRDGQGRLREADAQFCPVQSVTAVAVPANAQYFGPVIDISLLEWSADGAVVLAFPVVYSPQRWTNPVPLGRSATYNAALKLYPDELEVVFTAGRADAPPETFERVCLRLMVRLLLEQQDPDSLVARRQRVGDQTTEYRDDALSDILRPLGRWRR